jgi:hypothetical protein
MMRTADFGTPWRRPEATGGGPDRASRPSSRRRMQKRDSWTTRSTTRRRSCNSFQNASSSSSCAVFESSSAIFGMHSPSAGRAGRGSRTTRVLPLDMQASTGPSRLFLGGQLGLLQEIRRPSRCRDRHSLARECLFSSQSPPFTATDLRACFRLGLLRRWASCIPTRGKWRA